ncbi:hypothetical protein [Pontiella sulfatireligans]|uniref:Uncharacterized protein n=1 Tax=Pontiella sulfatireligans TaxID=2750658 RepID=A0A6C2UJ33_9BACT|nr:hypothetical protein [Pontiella sulfatireligans]VGO19324.1 hypothetical protein SCARR_01382 [Pontiella sulfatireligans]
MVNHASFWANGMAFADISRFARDDNFNLVAVAEVDGARLDRVFNSLQEPTSGSQFE